MAQRIDIVVALRDAASKGLKATELSVKGLSGAVKKSAGILTSFRTQMVGIGALFAGGAFFGNTIQTFAKFDDTMRQVGAVTGATKEQLASMTQVAKEMGATTRFSAAEAADGLRLLGMAGFEAQDAMDALPGVLNLAAAGSLDLATAADIATNVLAGFGLEVENLQQVNDVLVKTFTSSNTTLSELGEAFKLVGPIAKGVGADFEDLVGAIGQLGNAGLKGTLAGTALRGAINALFNPTNQEAKLMKNLAQRIGQTSLQVKDSEGDFVGFATVIEQLEKAGLKGEEALQLFGQRAGPGMAALLQVGSKKLKEYTDELKDADGVSLRIAKDMESGIGGALRELSASFEAVKITLGEAFGEDIIASVRSLRDWFIQLIEKIQEMRNTGKLAEYMEITRASIIGVYDAGKLLINILQDIVDTFIAVGAAATGNFEIAKQALIAIGERHKPVKKGLLELETTYYKIDKATGNVIDSTQKLTDTLKKMKTGEIGKGTKKELDEFQKQFIEAAKNIIDDDVLQKSSLQKLKATLGLELLIEQAKYDQRKTTAEQFYNEKIRIAQQALNKEIEILKSSLSVAETATAREKINTQIFVKQKELETQIFAINEQRFKDEKALDEERVKEFNRVEDLKLKAAQAYADQAARAKIDGSPGLDAQFQKETADLQVRQNKELEIVNDSYNSEIELLRQRGLNEFQIKEEMTNREIALNQFKNDQIAEQEKLAEDQHFRAVQAKFEASKQIAQGTAQLFESLYEATGKQTKEFFYIAKAAALAEATINIAQGITKAIAQGGIFGVIQGATVAASGAVQIAKIASQGLASGGEVVGRSPSPTADNIPIRATAGEFMQPVSAVQHYGKDVMEAIRQKAIPRDILKGFGIGSIKYGRRNFAEGGAVMPSSQDNFSQQGSGGERQTNIINVLDPSVFDQYTTSTPGQQNIMNVLSENKFQLKQLVFDNQN